MLDLFTSALDALRFYLGELARESARVEPNELEYGSGKRGAYVPSLWLPV